MNLLLRIRFIVLITISIRGVSCLNVQRWESDTWPNPIHGHTLSLVTLSTSSDNFAILVGGWPWSTVESNNSSFLLNLNNFTWSTVETVNTPPARHYHTTSISPTNYLWVFGGIRGTLSLNDLYSFDSDSFIWTIELSNSVGLYGHTSVFLPQSGSYQEMVVFGGSKNDNVPSNEVWMLSIYRNYAKSWSLINASSTDDVNIPRQRFFHQSTLYRYSLYIYGGTIDNVSPFVDPNVYVLDLSLNSWVDRISVDSYSSLQSSDYFTYGVFGHSSQLIYAHATNRLITEAIIVYSGGYSNGYTSQVVMYRIFTNQWISLVDASEGIRSNQPTARSSMATLSLNNLFFQFGGVNIEESNELNVLQFNFRNFQDINQLNDNSNPFSSVWVSSQIDNINILQYGSIIEFEFDGWGFSNTSLYQTSITLCSFVNPNDYGVDGLNQQDCGICIVSYLDFRKMICSTTFEPIGYFAVIAEILDTATNELVSKVYDSSFLCTRANYSQQDVQFPFGMRSCCLQVPVIDSISPSEGSEGTVLNIQGSFPDIPNRNINVHMGNTTCLVLDSTVSDFSCIVQSGVYGAPNVIKVTYNIPLLVSGLEVFQVVSATSQSEFSFQYLVLIQSLDIFQTNDSSKACIRFNGVGFDESTLIRTFVNFTSVSGGLVYGSECQLLEISNETFTCIIDVKSTLKDLVANIEIRYDNYANFIKVNACDEGSYSLYGNEYLISYCHFNDIQHYISVSNTLVKTQVLSETVDLTAILTATMLLTEKADTITDEETRTEYELSTIELSYFKTLGQTVTANATVFYQNSIIQLQPILSEQEYKNQSSTSNQSTFIYLFITSSGILVLLLSVILVLYIKKRRLNRRALKVYDLSEDNEEFAKNDIDKVIIQKQLK